jgi:hypothetical protein
MNDNHAIDMPSDYTDWVNVSYRVGQYLRPLVPERSLDLVPNYDLNFNIQPYGNGVASDPSNPALFYLGYAAPYWWTINWNSFGENLGRQYGGLWSYNDTFKENKARNEIKINENLNANEIVLEYIGDGMDADSATHIDSYAHAAIEAFAVWQFCLHKRNFSPSESALMEQLFIKEREVLTARKSDLNLDSFRRIWQKNSIAVKY